VIPIHATKPPDTPNFSVKTRLPKDKQSHLFSFVDCGDLKLYPGGKGRLKTIFYSPIDYHVAQHRHQFCGSTLEYTRSCHEAD